MRHKGSFEKKSLLHGYHFLWKPLALLALFKVVKQVKTYVVIVETFFKMKNRTKFSLPQNWMVLWI
jgi:hypothetical protein